MECKIDIKERGSVEGGVRRGTKKKTEEGCEGKQRKIKREIKGES